MLKKYLALSTMYLLCQTSFGASFDCAKARTWVEKTICSTPKLSKLDDELAASYQTERKQASGSALAYITQRQLSWLTTRRNTCTTVACLGREYQEKLGKKVTFYGGGDNTTPPANHAFGSFEQDHKIAIYNPEKPDGYERYDATDSVVIHPIPSKPNLSIVDIETVTTNAHLCGLSDAKFTWSENHWVYFEEARYNSSKIDDVSCELRLYPSKSKTGGDIYMVDIDNQCRRILCGARAALDDTTLSRR